MSIPSKTTIYDLPPSASERYAEQELSTRGSKLYPEISSTQTQTRPQVAVLVPAQKSQLETLTGALGKTHTLALYTAPQIDISPDVFTYSVFPTLMEKDVDPLIQKLNGLKTQDNVSSVETLIAGVKQLSSLNQMGHDVFGRCRSLEKG